MKKTQFALAALALVASTAAFAENTIYGNIDAGVANTTGKGTYLDGTGGWSAGNNIGFKGSSDIDGGMKATYQLEAGINTNGDVDNGGNNNGMFSRISTVGLSSELGSLTIGQQLSPYILAQALGTAGNGHFFVNRIIMGGGFGNAAVNTNADGGAFTFSGFFIPNAISYSTPSIGGLNATLLTSTRNGAAAGGVTAGNNSDRYDALMVSGTFGDVGTQLGYQKRQDTYTGTTASASYTMGPARVAGNYTTFKAEGGTSVNSYSLSGSYNVTAPLTVSLQYARNNLASAQTLANLGAQYALSKTTSLYATYGRGTNGAQSAYSTRGSYDTTGTSSTTTAVGVTHSF